MPNTRKILIVDDDPEMRDALTEQLSLHEEFEALAVENGSKGVQAAKAGQIDLVIMDVGLPDIDGREAVRILRKNGFKAPIIMLTGHDTDSDTILGLESGANDYVTKPFRFAVLLARIRAHVGRRSKSPPVGGACLVRLFLESVTSRGRRWRPRTRGTRRDHLSARHARREYCSLCRLPWPRGRRSRCDSADRRVSIHLSQTSPCAMD